MNWSINLFSTIPAPPASWHGLEVAYPDSVVYDSLYSLNFAVEGCWINGVRNCSASCSQPGLIWGDSSEIDFNVTANVNNCLAYMVLATVMASPNTTVDTEYFEAFGIEKDPDRIQSLNINASISGCITSFCRTTGKCKESVRDGTTRWYELSIDGLSNVSSLLYTQAILQRSAVSLTVAAYCVTERDGYLFCCHGNGQS